MGNKFKIIGITFISMLAFATVNGYYNCQYNEYDCSDFSESEAQDVYEYCYDIVGYDVHGLDADSDGEACETESIPVEMTYQYGKKNANEVCYSEYGDYICETNCGEFHGDAERGCQDKLRKDDLRGKMIVLLLFLIIGVYMYVSSSNFYKKNK